ncbi:MAG TPA: Na/Pi cotransporter family protein [Candidatus Lachnoclostridium pullistercoris]|uniref:Na/Pi cotransporter family protein n=1 Tax=Candidatus Lachnoclostridium pullistercoris TaxID=2838632 RepID=A0A9D2PCG5_9FIRM|nr:Na/Pi cotransporter family protein [Candidatus Lachnoclostridium pullistercoris]
MSISDVSSLFTFAGGLGMFLYGMNIMADGMQKTAGGKMKQFLGMLTNNRVMGVILGALITAIIQSSGATTVMVVGFVSAGIMSLSQAVGVIMGANIGTTITAWIVSMSQLGEAFEAMKPEFYAPLLIGIGALLIVFAKRPGRKQAGEILVGLGLLFVGLDFMSSSIAPYTDSPIFARAFALLGGNPILGMIIGLVVTALLQSSSASVGILQTLALNGIVTTNAAIYITLGQNIGSCVTALISSIGGSRTAKRAACIHLSFNVIGSLLFGAAGLVIFTIFPDFAASPINAVEISMFHTVFNLTNTVILFPFAEQLVKLSGRMVPEKAEESGEEDEETKTLRHLDERIFESPAFALETASSEVVHMGEVTLNNLERAIQVLKDRDTRDIEVIMETEKTIDHMEKMLTEYLIKVDNLSLNEHQKLVVANLFYSVSDIERVGDHCENLAELAEDMKAKEISFTGEALEELKNMSTVVLNSFRSAVEARRSGSMDAVRRVSQLEDEADSLEEELRERHIERLSAGECSTSAGIVFLDILTNLERVSDHAYNLAGYVKDEL